MIIELFSRLTWIYEFSFLQVHTGVTSVVYNINGHCAKTLSLFSTVC